MSSTAVAEWNSETGNDAGGNEFSYRPFPPLVPVTGAFVVLSLSAFLWYELLAVPVLGLLLGLTAIWQIKRSQGAYGGLLVATVSSGLIVGIAVVAVGFHAVVIATELPPGLQRVSFVNDISSKELVIRDDVVEVDPDVKKLDGTPVFLKGFMYPTRDTHGKTSFVLCKDNGQCCFGGTPKITDMIYVEMKPGQKVDHYAGLVAVGGEFRIQPKLESGLSEAGDPVYKLECGYFRIAKTAW
jgi:hypothetical protein